jgi:glycosyltransferase involved in cell wall biosynthesis
VDETLESVTMQTYSDLEIMVCDDCSTDGTAEKILDWAKRDDRIIPMLSDRNEGLSVNLNKGFDRATGEFLSIMGGDDKMALNKIEQQVDFLNKNPDYDAVLHWVEVFDSENGKTLSTINSNILESPLDWVFPKVSFIVSKKDNNSTFPPTAYLARSVYALHSRYDYRLKFKNEILFAIDNYMNKPQAKWHCIPEVLGYYRMHEKNMHKSKEMNDALLEETYVNYAIASARYPALSRKLKRGLQYFLYRQIYHSCIQSDKKDIPALSTMKTRFRAETGWLRYWYVMTFLNMKLLYHKVRG